MHIFGCGHTLHYMERYSNLYRYSQQGWEGLNAKIKSMFFHHARKGGGKLSNREAALHLNSIGLFLIRDLMWRSGLGEEFFYVRTGNGKDGRRNRNAK